MRVRYTPRARDDLTAIRDYLRQRSPQGTRNVLAAIFREPDSHAAYLLQQQEITLTIHEPAQGSLIGQEGEREAA